eukprot:g2034.t1
MRASHSFGSSERPQPKLQRHGSGSGAPKKRERQSLDEWKRKNEERQELEREREDLAGRQDERLVKRSRKMGKPGALEDEWKHCWKPLARKKAIIKGLDRIFSMAQLDENFNLFGNDVIQCFYDVATVSGEPLRRRALMYVEQLAHRWKHEVMHRGWKQGLKPTPQEVIDAVIGMYCLERLGIHHQLKAEVVTFLNLAESDGGYSVKMYLGWDPHNQEPPADLEDGSTKISQQRTMSNSLIHSFYAERVGVSFGAGYDQVFKWLPTVRPYRGPSELSWQHYIDQCYLVTHIVFTLNNWGELQLDPQLLPHEYYFIREHMAVQIKHGDVHLVGEFVECLRAFGATDTDSLVQKGMAFLMSCQEEDGSWDNAKETDDYTTYHATMVGVQALLQHRYRGFGPGMEKITPILRKWYSEEIAGGKGAKQKAKAGASAQEQIEPDDFEAKGQHDPRMTGLATTMASLEREWGTGGSASASGEGGSSGGGGGSGGSSGAISEAEVTSIGATLKAIAQREKQGSAEPSDVRTAIAEIKKLQGATDGGGFSTELLKSTGIGKVVGKLRKSADQSLAKSAKALVASWKQLVV